MDLEKSILLQKQVKDNSEDLQNEFRDLKNWEEQMKRKDQELRNAHEEQVLPPVRSKRTKMVPKPESKEKDKTKTVNRIKSYDYTSWEKFDVDKACKEVDQENNSDESGEEPLSKEELEKSHDKASSHKEQGNIFVQQKKWDKAIACYSEAIKIFPYDAVFYANRALCYLKTDNLYSAEADCSTALQLDETYIKAYHRRAMARIALKQYKDAKLDLEKILKLEPSSKETVSLLVEVNQKIEKSKLNNGDEHHVEEKPIEKKIGEKFCGSSNVNKELNKEKIPSKLVSKQTISQNTETHLPIPDWLPEKNNVAIIKPISKPPHLRSKKPLKSITVKEVEFGIVDEEVKKSIESQGIEVTSSEKVEKIAPKERSSFTLPSKPPEVCDIPPVPKTAVQFLMDWKRNSSAEFRYAYLKQIPTANLPTIFQDSMESDILCTILTVLKSQFTKTKEPVFSYLEYLSKIKRFRALIMFMSNKEKEDLKYLFNYCKIVEGKSESDIQELRSIYEI